MNLRIKEGAAWQMALTIWADEDRTTAFDLTGYTGACEFIRTDTLAVVATPTVTVTDATAGQALLELTAVETEAIPTGDSAPTIKYDLFFESASPDRFCPVEGTVTVLRRWTQP